MTDEIHVSTRDTPGDYDAIETAKPGEPLFGIQGGDPLGPPTVQFWADEARKLARKIMSGGDDFVPTRKMPNYNPTAADQERAEKLLRKATAAEMVSWAMRDYQRGGVQEVAGERAHYNDTPLDSAVAHDQRRALILMVTELHNSLSIAHDVAEALDNLGVYPDAVNAINGAVCKLKAAADTIEPRRGMERS